MPVLITTRSPREGCEALASGLLLSSYVASHLSEDTTVLNKMALRSSFRLLSSAGTKSVPPPGVASSIRERLATGKLLRPDVADDILRKPVDEAKYRSPAPGYVLMLSRSRATHFLSQLSMGRIIGRQELTTFMRL